MIIEVDVLDHISGQVSDRDRIRLIFRLLETIQEDETIGRIRKMVNSSCYDDQPAPEKP